MLRQRCQNVTQGSLFDTVVGASRAGLWTRKGRRHGIPCQPALRRLRQLLKASLTLSPACLRSALLWSDLPSACISRSSLASPSFSLPLPSAPSALCLSSSFMAPPSVGPGSTHRPGDPCRCPYHGSAPL